MRSLHRFCIDHRYSPRAVLRAVRKAAFPLVKKREGGIDGRFRYDYTEEMGLFVSSEKGSDRLSYKVADQSACAGGLAGSSAQSF